MNTQNFNDDVNPLTNRSSSNSGGAPDPFNKESGPFSDSWDWNIYVEPLQPGETATCHVMLGVDDNGSLKVDGILRIQGIATTETNISLQEVFQREVNIDFIDE